MDDKNCSIVKKVPYYIYPGLQDDAKEEVVLRYTGAPNVSLQQIATVVEEEFGVSLERMKAPSRKHEVVMARTAFCSIARSLTCVTYSALGKFLNRDHSTMIYTIDKNKVWIKVYPEYKKLHGLAFGRCSLNIFGDENDMEYHGY